MEKGQAVIPPGWVDTTEAEQVAGRTIKTIQRLMREGLIEVERREIEVAGRSKPVTIYKRDDLARIAGGAGETQALTVAPPRAIAPAGIEILARQLAELVRVSAAPPVPPQHKVLLTLEEAYRFSGVPRAHLRRMRDDQDLVYRSGKRYLYRRRVLETL